jgi:hypothetical protein
MCDSYQDEHAIYSDFHHTSGHTYAPTFTAREDMIPYEDKVNFDISNGLGDPFALYAARTNGGITLPNDFIEKPYLPKDFTEAQLQDACNQMCDVLGIRHLPISITDTVPNAQHSTLVGPFRFTLVDDALSFNPDYAKACIEHIGSSDIILSDVAHEIGHGMASIYCGKLSTYTNEKLADFISGFLNCKMGVDIDVARQWFQWEYDPMGQGGYPVSEERWDIESAGYFFGTLTDAEGLKKALQDPDFLRYALMRIAETKDNIRRFTELYNNHEHVTFAADPNTILLNKFSIAAKFNLKADTYNAEMIGIGDYDKVSAWQAAISTTDSTPYNFAAASSISLSDAAATEAGLTGEGAGEITGVVGVIYDRLAMGVTIDKKKTTSQYSASRDTTNFFYHALANYIVNDNYPIVTFVIRDTE